MADDFEAATASLGGPSSWAANSSGDSGLSKRLSSYDERLQDMRRQIRQQHERHKRTELRRKNQEKEMVEKWLRHQENTRRQQKEEIANRISELCVQQLPKSKASDADLIAQHCEQAATSAGSFAGGGSGAASHGARTEEVIEESRQSLTAASPRSLAARHTGLDASDSQEAAILPSLASAAAPQDVTSDAPAKKGGGALPRLRKKKREEIAAPLRPGGAQREKSIMQQAQEQFQGLCRSADGRKILELGTRHQRSHREALVKGDLVAVERAEHEAKENENGREEEREAEDQELPAVNNKNMARRYRLRMMHQITSQVLQCRKKMTSNMQQGSLPSGLGCRTQANTSAANFFSEFGAESF